MSQLEWSDALALDLPAMDETHQEFVDLLAQVGNATDDELLTRWRALVEHTDEHFSREDRWMESTRFAAGNCHSVQHNVVLQVMREGTVRGERGDLPLVRQMAHELGIWFPQHAQAMDAALALHLRRVGYDPLTDTVSMPDALPQDMIHGCGGSTCSDPTSQTSAAEAPAHAA